MRRAPLITADKFKTTKDADAIADFYSTEDFLQILGIFPMAIHFVLAGVDWDPKRENTMKVWDSMQISFDITEKEEIIDGKTAVTMFNKRAHRAAAARPFGRAHTCCTLMSLLLAPASQVSASSTTSRSQRSCCGIRCRTMAIAGCPTARSR